MAVQDFLKKLQSPNAFQEIIDEQDLPLAPGVSYDQLEQEQLDKQAAADALLNDTVAADNVPKEEQAQREAIQQAAEPELAPGLDEAVSKIKGSYGEEERAPATDTEKPKDPQQELLDQLNKMREDRDKKVDEGASRDKWMDVANRINKSLALKDAGTAMRASHSKDFKPVESFDLKTTHSKEAMDKETAKINEMLKQYSILKKNQGLTEKDKAYIDLQKQNLQLRKETIKDSRDKFRESEDRRKEGQARGLNKNIYGVVKDFKQDKLSQELDKQGLSFDQADDLMEQIKNGNEIALGALGTKMAKSMGEVGALSETDVNRYVQAQSLVQKAKDKYGKNFKGKLSPETLKDIKDVTKMMREGFSKRREQLMTQYVDFAYENFGKPEGMSRDEIMERFGIKQPKKTPSMESAAKKAPEKKAGKVSVQLPNGKTGKIDTDKLAEFLKDVPGAKVLE